MQVEIDQDGPIAGATPLKPFCRRNGIGLSTAYAEIATGRLVAHKCRGKTLITRQEEARWLRSLPRLTKRASAA